MLSAKLNKNIDFKTISIDDKELINSYLFKVNYRACTLSFTNMFAWRKVYDTKFDVINDNLIIQTRYDKNIKYLMPIGGENKKETLLQLIDYAGQNSQEFSLASLTDEMIEELEVIMPGQFEYITNRDYSDYLYKTQSLIKLSGKKLHSKRNHINKFKASYNYEYVDITKDNIAQCVELHKEWCRINNCDGDDKEINDETCAVRCMLKHFFELDVFGGAILVDGQMVAFTIASQISKDTIDIHVEKAIYDYNGIYAAINQFFLEKNHRGAEFVNREEDLGKEGLRKSKLSYNPDIILDKRIAVFKK